MPFMIRRLSDNDREFFLRLAKEFYSSKAVSHAIPEEYHERTFDELMRSDVYAECYIIEKDERPAGYALTAKTFSQEAGGPVIWIEELYILPEYRGHGLGSKFLQWADENLASGAARLRLEVEDDNKGAISLYKRLGYQALDYRQMMKEFQLVKKASQSSPPERRRN